MPRPSQTWPLASTASSCASGVTSGRPWSRGTKAARMAKASTPIAATARKALRQPNIWPIQAPAGTPSRVARVRPENISAIADAFLSTGTSPVATTAPTPKKVPWVSEVSTRADISHS